MRHLRKQINVWARTLSQTKAVELGKLGIRVLYDHYSLCALITYVRVWEKCDVCIYCRERIGLS